MRRTQNSRNSGGGGGGNANQSSNGTPSSGGQRIHVRLPTSAQQHQHVLSRQREKLERFLRRRVPLGQARDGSGRPDGTVWQRLGRPQHADRHPTAFPAPPPRVRLGRATRTWAPSPTASSTLERKRKGLTPSKSTGAAQTDRDFQSNSLGRRRLFGSKGSLSNKAR
ncbi:hypothetical protein BaRGS_00008693 [Batillaria attramentaria]|uniref:Uncharacterized protein n=1 Tax=Batillaria attramentaria TaxID=370345 RepID=A0ABD0LLL4_9CAEN